MTLGLARILPAALPLRRSFWSADVTAGEVAHMNGSPAADLAGRGGVYEHAREHRSRYANGTSMADPFWVTDICLDDMVICMRTTLDLDDHLMRAVKKRAAETGRTMTAIVEESLRAALTAPPAAKRRTSWDWITVRGKVRPGVDVTDRDHLYDVMDGRA